MRRILRTSAVQHSEWTCSSEKLKANGPFRATRRAALLNVAGIWWLQSHVGVAEASENLQLELSKSPIR